MVVDLSMTMCRMWCLQAMFRLRALRARACGVWMCARAAARPQGQWATIMRCGQVSATPQVEFVRRPAQYFGLFQCMHLRATVYGPTSFYNDQHASTFSSVVRLNVVT